MIYSLRLLNPSPKGKPIPHLRATDAAIAAHIWRYRAELAAFAIGNEPDRKAYHRSDPNITGYRSYLAQWRRFAHAILAAAPGARFAGPDTGAYTPATYVHGQSWTQRFAADQKGSVARITQHQYVGAGPGATTADQAIDNLLSPNWVAGSAIA